MPPAIPTVPTVRRSQVFTDEDVVSGLVPLDLMSRKPIWSTMRFAGTNEVAGLRKLLIFVTIGP
ncbi:hypothetical protein GCM10020218_020570 [Dactylosporangium vinaceum]